MIAEGRSKLEWERKIPDEKLVDLKDMLDSKDFKENLPKVSNNKNFLHTGAGVRHVLDEKFQRNASKFAIFYVYENPKLPFPFFISCYTLFFPLMNALVYVDKVQGIH